MIPLFLIKFFLDIKKKAALVLTFACAICIFTVALFCIYQNNKIRYLKDESKYLKKTIEMQNIILKITESHAKSSEKINSSSLLSEERIKRGKNEKISDEEFLIESQEIFNNFGKYE